MLVDFITGPGLVPIMFHELVAEPGGLTPEELYHRYVSELAAVVDDHGVETVRGRSDLDEATVESIKDGEPPELTLSEAAEVLAVRPDAPSADAIAAASRDSLLMGMTNAVVDVEALSAGIGRELEPGEIQSKVEGRYPVTLAEFALLQQFLAERRTDRG